MSYGTDIEAALEIMMALENSVSLEEAVQIYENHCQNHLNLWSTMVRNIVFTFSSKGPELWEATADREISRENSQTIEAKKLENIVLAEANSTKSKGSR